LPQIVQTAIGARADERDVDALPGDIGCSSAKRRMAM
jgi:hypothetical protein